MRSRSMKFTTGFCLTAVLMFTACAPALKVREPRTQLPSTYTDVKDKISSANVPWSVFHSDPHLRALIDTALVNNQELNILLQEIEVVKNEARIRKGEYLPFIGLGAAAEVEKVGRFTRNGAVEHNLEIDHHQEFPEPLPNYALYARATWELDIWKKLRNARQAAVLRYLGSIEGRNFMVTNLVAEIANTYFELLALDNQMLILQSNIAIQQEALGIVKMEKQAAKVTELAVRRFEAEVLKNRSIQFDIQQQIIETENRLNFLVGRYPRPIERTTTALTDMVPATVQPGIPAQLLSARPDVREAELELSAAKLDVKAARASFYPSLGLNAAVGVEAFDPELLFETPASLLYGLAGDLVQPLVNRNAIKAEYASANARQLQTLYDYERTVLNAYVEVVNQISNVNNLRSSYELREQQVNALNSSINISSNLFRSARADYMEVLLTQRDALEAEFELVETRKQQLNAMVNMYQALGGGWR